MNLEKLKDFEGVVHHLYLDSLGHVTTGCGHLCRTVGDVLSIHGWDNTAAARADWDVLQNFKRGVLPEFFKKHSSRYYAQYCQARLTSKGIDDLALEDVRRETGLLRKSLPEFDTYPDTVKDALEDMAFNLGGAFMEKRNADGNLVWLHLPAAVRLRKWSEAAAHCDRKQVSKHRNDWTRAQFLAAF